MLRALCSSRAPRYFRQVPQDIIRGNEECFSVQIDGRAICTLNQHVFKQPNDLQAFISGSKYKQLRSAAELDRQLKSLEPYFTASKNFPGKVFCTLTCHIMNINHANVANHVAGKRYRLAKDLHAKGELELFKEPDMGTEPDCEGIDVEDADNYGPLSCKVENDEDGISMDMEPSQPRALADQEESVIRPHRMTASTSRCRESRPKRVKRAA